MKLLAELSERSLGLNPHQRIIGETFTVRKSARAIVINKDGLMALQHIQKYHYHKLPGGGMELGEDIEQTLHREIKEEVGCDITVVQPIGVVITYHAQLLHLAYGFVVSVNGELVAPTFDAAEQAAEQTTVWLLPQECVSVLKDDLVQKGGADFILQRELCFLETYLRDGEANQHPLEE